MVRRRLLLTILLVVSACGGGAGQVDTDATTTVATLAPGNCPSGVIASRGDGADYLNIGGSYQRAGAGQIPDGVPVHLGPAVAAIPADVMVGLLYTGCTSLGGASNFEEMAWTNGIGLMLVSWYEWPRVADPSTAPFGGVASQAGVVQVSRLETGSEESRMRVVRFFDGLKVLSISTYGLTIMGIDQVEEVGWMIYDGLPVDMAGAVGDGSPKVPDVLASLRSGPITVSEATPIADVSPFTARAGLAHTSYAAVVNGTDVRLYDFGTAEVAEHAARLVSTDGYSIAHQPNDWAAAPHFWLVGRVLLLYQGGSTDFLEFLTEELGAAVAGGLPPEG